MAPGPGEVRPTAGAPRPVLEELLQQVRRALAARDEEPTGAWVEETATELARGNRPGVYRSPEDGGGGLAFYARRGPAAFAHLHTGAGLAAARALADALLDPLPPEVAWIDLGFSGLSGEDERRLVDELLERPGSLAIAREALERPLTAADGRAAADPPAGVERVPVRAVTLDALAELDRAAFAGSTDDLLLGSEAEAHRRSVEALLDHRLGRFLDEASCALLEGEPVRLVGAVLCAERSSRRAIVLDLMVDPAQRRRGLGRYLIGWSLRALWALGYESVVLWASIDNAPALALYRSLGFRTQRAATIYRWARTPAAPQPQASR
jgi:ribosomal protein S18 acetylase RimI-like enzyme